MELPDKKTESESPFWIKYGQKFTYLDIKDSMFAMKLRSEYSSCELNEMYQGKRHCANREVVRKVLEERGINVAPTIEIKELSK